MSDELDNKNIQVILIQIDEAHTTAWPQAIDVILNVEQPEPQKTFNDRVNRAGYFVEKYHPPYNVYIDSWDNQFAELFRAWPDKYHLIDKNKTILAKSKYNKEGIILEDCTVLLQKLIEQ
ncbi:hypothetical protein Klosneuvirus_1_118 [Klosneuvirus KNV1]|uniref:Uncharacterized protein n=1 Tax=Klosneuvirus KNV1 TaxID=1977640 RepID=A0A1V0SHX1_9VIRU|nr:hypothetical protein Klosneuvirus_1_118 [Klosneuvirus KNV1]